MAIEKLKQEQGFLRWMYFHTSERKFAAIVLIFHRPRDADKIAACFVKPPCCIIYSGVGFSRIRSILSRTICMKTLRIGSMMKKYLALLLILLSACVRYDERVGTVSNSDIFCSGRPIKAKQTIKNVTGTDGASTVFIVPLGEPSISRAIDNALKPHDANALVNARIRHTFWLIPYIYMWQKITITGDAVVFEKN
jgi:hypothetical protein